MMYDDLRKWDLLRRRIAYVVSNLDHFAKDLTSPITRVEAKF